MISATISRIVRNFVPTTFPSPSATTPTDRPVQAPQDALSLSPEAQMDLQIFRENQEAARKSQEQLQAILGESPTSKPARGFGPLDGALNLAKAASLDARAAHLIDAATARMGLGSSRAPLTKASADQQINSIDMRAAQVLQARQALMRDSKLSQEPPSLSLQAWQRHLQKAQESGCRPCQFVGQLLTQKDGL